MNFTILQFDSLPSTNTEALVHAKRGAAEGLCIIARQQAAGRGRQGRTWVSENDSGLYFSIVLRPKIEMRFLPLITLMTGVAVHDTLAEFGLRPDIKWVNDLHVNGKKISGILAETTDTGKGLAVIVGIGINIKNSSFPPEIAGTATSIESETGHTVTIKDLAEGLTRFISFFYGVLNDNDGHAAIIKEWQRRSSYFSGKNVRVTFGNETITGTTDGLESNGALRILTEDGDFKIIQAGDVEQLRQITD